MRLSLRGANPAEWLALRAGIVPIAADETCGGMASSAIPVTAVRMLRTVCGRRMPSSDGYRGVNLDEEL